jgi:hypothetical protein
MFFFPRNASEQNSESLILFRKFAPTVFLLYGTGLELFFFIFHSMIQKGILKVCFYCCSTVRNSEHFSQLFGMEFRELASILFHGTKFRAFFSLAEWLGTTFLEFSVPRNKQNSVGTNHLFHLYCLPWNYFFGRKFPTLPSTQEFLGLNGIDLLNLHYNMKRGCNRTCNLFQIPAVFTFLC